MLPALLVFLKGGALDELAALHFLGQPPAILARWEHPKNTAALWGGQKRRLPLAWLT